MIRLFMLGSLLVALALFVPTAHAAEESGEGAASHAAEAEHDAPSHGESASHEEATPDPLEFDPDLAIWTLIVFLAMLAVLMNFAWGPIMKALADREESISGAIEAATAKHEEAKALLAEHEKKLAGTADEVRALLDQAHRDAERTKADLLGEAKSLADRERERAVSDISQARDAVVRELAEQTAGLAVDLAAKVVKQDISAARQGEIVKEALGRFAAKASDN